MDHEWLRRASGKRVGPGGSGEGVAPEWLPDDDVLVGLAAGLYRIHRSTYLTTRTREDFVDDCRTILADKLLPIEVIAQALNMGGDKDEQVGAPKSDEIASPNKDVHKRSMTSSRPYAWHRRVQGRRYTVHNMDTRSPSQFKRSVGTLGSLIGTKPQ